MNRFLTAAILIAVLGLSACTRPDRFGGADGTDGTNGLPGTGGIDQNALGGDPASPAYFSQTIGDRVLFVVDQSTLTAEATNTLNGQAQWLLVAWGWWIDRHRRTALRTSRSGA